MPAMPVQELSISDITYTTTANVTLEWEPTEWLIVNRATSAGDVIYFSFDGTADHGVLIPGSNLTGVTYRFRAKKLWLRTTAMSAGNVPVVALACSER